MEKDFFKRLQVKNLQQSRKDLVDEFETWGYTSEYPPPFCFLSKKVFLTKMSQIDKVLYELGQPATLNYQP